MCLYESCVESNFEARQYVGRCIFYFARVQQVHGFRSNFDFDLKKTSPRQTRTRISVNNTTAGIARGSSVILILRRCLFFLFFLVVLFRVLVPVYCRTVSSPHRWSDHRTSASFEAFSKHSNFPSWTSKKRTFRRRLGALLQARNDLKRSRIVEKVYVGR